MWINEGTYSKSEVAEAFHDNNVYEVNLSEFNNGKGRDYSYWAPIVHPETGEQLVATKGYLSGEGNTCYYAEYRDRQGNYYNYTAGMNGESILSQQNRDGAIPQSQKDAESRASFTDMMNGKTSNVSKEQNNANEHTNLNGIKR